jgi:hypothetical protein
MHPFIGRSGLHSTQIGPRIHTYIRTKTHTRIPEQIHVTSSCGSTFVSSQLPEPRPVTGLPPALLKGHLKNSRRKEMKCRTYLCSAHHPPPGTKVGASLATLKIGEAHHASNMCMHMHVCVFACVCTCMCARVCACVFGRLYVRPCVCLCVCACA